MRSAPGLCSQGRRHLMECMACRPKQDLTHWGFFSGASTHLRAQGLNQSEDAVQHWEGQVWPAGRPGRCWRGTQPQEGLLTNGSQVLLIRPTDDLLQHSLGGRRLLCAAGIALCLGLLCSTERRSGLPCMCTSSESSCTSDELPATTCHAADVGAVGPLHQLLTGTHAP